MRILAFLQGWPRSALPSLNKVNILVLQQSGSLFAAWKIVRYAPGIHIDDNCYGDLKLVKFAVNAIVMMRRNKCRPFAVIIVIGKYHVNIDH
ncbi:hypothetical protein HNR39_002438 [Glaciimonas immobilis]|uniref:Uncharacterized protein n=1 Tax=Glaciimonas immobilis TaxID=728004 RepID=A0A840RUM8_9BURK|nr:hypothetical protein [Glaciimonas immobilis]